MDTIALSCNSKFIFSAGCFWIWSDCPCAKSEWSQRFKSSVIFCPFACWWPWKSQDVKMSTMVWNPNNLCFFFFHNLVFCVMVGCFSHLWISSFTSQMWRHTRSNSVSTFSDLSWSGHKCGLWHDVTFFVECMQRFCFSNLIWQWTGMTFCYCTIVINGRRFGRDLLCGLSFLWHFFAIFVEFLLGQNFWTSWWFRLCLPIGFRFFFTLNIVLLLCGHHHGFVLPLCSPWIVFPGSCFLDRLVLDFQHTEHCTASCSITIKLFVSPQSSLDRVSPTLMFRKLVIFIERQRFCKNTVPGSRFFLFCFDNFNND